MYFLFRFHHILPSAYKEMKKGEREVVKAFMYRQINDMNEERGY